MSEYISESTDFKNSVGIVKTEFFHFADSPDELVLSNGFRLGPIDVALSLIHI